MTTPAGFRNVSDTTTEKYQTEDGSVTIQRAGARTWVVMPRGAESFYANGKGLAIASALAIVGRRAALVGGGAS